ncbi:hypothetical protein GTS_54660 [Gandjariella thermophila]|uniref:Uncharacterized protein n=1 Tax=Gandjariella thermophila TaxID=1931992 RepID=A0A4D4JIW4_9PSEU|nr:hypothetical protein GTS_54660 [Gandjariella thermophila]
MVSNDNGTPLTLPVWIGVSEPFATIHIQDFSHQLHPLPPTASVTVASQVTIQADTRRKVHPAPRRATAHHDGVADTDPPWLLAVEWIIQCQGPGGKRHTLLGTRRWRVHGWGFW